MDFWEFLARSEWPVVVAGGLYAFREPIKRKLESAVKASGFGMSVEFPEQQRLAHQAEDELKKEVETLKEVAAKPENAALAATAAKIEAAAVKFAAANNAVTASAILSPEAANLWLSEASRRNAPWLETH